MKKFKIILVSLFLCINVLNANNLPVEPSLIKGELQNGFKYTIKKNKKPENKVTLRLIVKAGSLDEDDDQKGIAHFVEHMAFNGTKHFKGNEVIKFLESIGIGFGADINASTTTTRTLYKLDIPLKNDNLEKSIMIFSDWAGGVSFTQKELDKERGVILEEARSSYGLNFRLYQQMKSTIYEGSKYKDRTPIGDLDIVRNVSLQRVKDFYDDWYRPELMHFVVVGDIDVDKVEEMIKEKFSYLKNTSKRVSANRAIKKVNKTRILVVKDKELVNSSVSINYYHDKESIKNDQDYKELVKRSIALNLFNLRASEQVLKLNPIAKNISLKTSPFVSNLRTFSFSTSYLDSNNSVDALKELTSLMYSVKKYGFNKDDFKRIVKELTDANLEGYKYLEGKSSKSYANQIVGYALKNEIFVDEKYSIKLVNEILKNITLKEVNEAYNNIFNTKSVIITYKVNPNIKIPQQKVMDIFKNANKHTVKEKATVKLPKKIDTSYLKPIKFKKEVYNKKYDFYEFTLDNDLKVVYKFSDKERNKVFITAISKGGYSLYDTKDLTNAKYATTVISQSGLDKYNILDVNKIYNSKYIEVNPQINRYNESLMGTTTTDDFELLMQRIYLITKKYRFDNNIFLNIKNSMVNNLTKKNKIPNNRFKNELLSFYFDGNKRFLKTTAEDIKSLNKEDILKIYKDRFSDLNNFTFFIIGDVTKEKVKEYASLYLGNIPTSNRNETYNFRGEKPRSGEQKFIRNYNNENISFIKISYKIDLPYSLENSVNLGAFKEVLNMKLREYIREEKSGVYRVNVQTSFIREPYEKAGISISFTCDPKRKDEIVSYVYQVLNKMKNEKVSSKYTDAIITKSLLSLSQAKDNPIFWLQTFKNAYYYGSDINDIDNYKKFYKSISPSIIKKQANLYFNAKDILYTELNPKDKKE